MDSRGGVRCTLKKKSYLSSASVQIYLNANAPPVYSSERDRVGLQLIDPGQATRSSFHKSFKCI